MKTMHGLLSLHLLVFALGLALLLGGCGRRDGAHSSAPPERVQRSHYLLGSTVTRSVTSGVIANDEMDSSVLVLHHLQPERYADNQPTGDRDLGPGAGGERLGDPSQLAKQYAPEPLAGERYAALYDNPFRATNQAGGDASTFGLEVDRAAMATLRRWVQRHGRLPPPAAVRIEEMLNSMHYDYPQPDANSESFFAIDHQVIPSPWADGHWLLRIGVQAKSLTQETRPPLNLVFLIDTSGSMHGPERLPLVKHTLLTLLESLDERDTLSIVTYAGSSQVLLPATPANQQVRIRKAIESLHARGSTNGGGGINAAYAEAIKRHGEGVHSRVVLCTDGDFNVGVNDPSQLQKLITEQRKSGVYLSVYGYGSRNYNDHLMKTLALHGNGIYTAITDRDEAQRIAGDDALGQMVTVAKDAKVQMFFNPQVVVGWRLIGYENRVLRREDFNNDQVDSGEIGAGHQCTVLYEIIPAGSVVPGASADDNPFLAPAQSSSTTSDQKAVIDPNALGQLRLRAQPASGGPSVLQEHLIAASVAEADSNTHLAAAIAALGMRLRASPHRGSADFSMAARLLAAAASDHPQQQAERKQLAALIRSIQGL